MPKFRYGMEESTQQDLAVRAQMIKEALEEREREVRGLDSSMLLPAQQMPDSGAAGG